MGLLKRIKGLLASNTFEGSVVHVRQIFKEGRNTLHNQKCKVYVGEYNDGKCIHQITRDAKEGVFYICLENKEGVRKLFRTDVCIEPAIGEIERYSLYSEVKPEDLKIFSQKI